MESQDFNANLENVKAKKEKNSKCCFLEEKNQYLQKLSCKKYI